MTAAAVDEVNLRVAEVRARLRPESLVVVDQLIPAHILAAPDLLLGYGSSPGYPETACALLSTGRVMYMVFHEQPGVLAPYARVNPLRTITNIDVWAGRGQLTLYPLTVTCDQTFAMQLAERL